MGPGPCPPCERVGYPECMWNNFGILIWDYDEGGTPRDVLIDGVTVENASMGLHFLGGTSAAVRRSRFAWNGNGNAFFHNAYFLRMANTTIADSSFVDSTGHGLKLTTQNDTVIESCVVARNGWQGIWVGTEAPRQRNYRLAIRNTTVDANGKNGVALAETTGFELTDLRIRFHATVDMAGGAPPGSTNARLGTWYA